MEWVDVNAVDKPLYPESVDAIDEPLYPESVDAVDEPLYPESPPHRWCLLCTKRRVHGVPPAFMVLMQQYSTQ